jgi:REP element-mobilizing transposase RayT
LKDELLTFTPREIEIIANSFSTVISEQGYTCYGCAIMPDHVHLVIRKHKNLAEKMIEHLQFGSRHELLMERMNNHRIGVGRGGKCFWIRQKM